MILYCQRNSFETEYTTTVLSCKEAALSKHLDGKKESLQVYEVLLEDTLLFPEGGGQPSDHGWLDGEEVIHLERRGDDVIHSVKVPFMEGQVVKQTLDWELRFDRMQQHTGQHLVTALADKHFGFNTTSWWLGDKVCHIELESASGNMMTEKEMKNLEKMVNDKIRDALPIKINVYDDNDPHLKSVRTRGLPEGFKGQVRVVSIEGIEDNMCCGTHLNHLGQLQAIKLLSVEKGKMRGGKQTRSFFLYFLAGGRVLSRLEESLQREAKLTALLKNGPPEHIELVDKLQKSYKQCNKNLQALSKNIAVLEAEKFKALDPKPKVYSLHRKEAEADFMAVFINEIGNQDSFFFLTTGDPVGTGNMILYGDPKIVDELGPKLNYYMLSGRFRHLSQIRGVLSHEPHVSQILGFAGFRTEGLPLEFEDRVCEILGGKGAGKGHRFQAKVTKLKARPEAEALIQKFLDSNLTGQES